jgi:hypothetical protein
MYGFCGPSELFFLLIIGLIVLGVVWWKRREQGKPFNPVIQKPAWGVATPEIEAPPTSFAEVKLRADALRLQVRNGQLSEVECKQRMRDLMLQDANGVWWMVGYESGAWYRHDGDDWVQDDGGPG